MTKQQDCYHLGIKALLRNEEGEFLLLEGCNRESSSYWDIPGGRVDIGESIQETLKRELKEEIGLLEDIKTTHFITIPTEIRIKSGNQNVGLILSFYLGEIKSTFTPKLSFEHKSYKWHDTSSAVKLLQKQYPPLFITKLLQLEHQLVKNK